ncbi:hypothetical protein UVI_02040290 [Ustilaginoidea virens]|uniref:DUF1746 domain-containing protein n=1 Tax=Ustilaginoidea virens TaxID=1159556 RepID=A0A1B5KYQ2_USTVR|nr:hypothetical protein UVI_02040290 [Ustilaginoidea virens]
MNHDHAASSPGPSPDETPMPQLDDDDTASIPTHNGPTPVGAFHHGESQPPSPSRSRRRRKKKNKKERHPGLVKKLSFVTHLLKSLDLLVFAEISSLYYMEAVGQYMYLTPKDESIPFFMPSGRLHVLLVLIPNLLCMIFHLFASLPHGPEFHRGYQHGGLIIDFVGQRPATSRLYYLAADITILAVQCLMLAIHTQREQLRVALKTFRPILPEFAEEMQAALLPVQDLDAEERGVSLHDPDIAFSGLNDAATDENGNVEMQLLDGSREQGGGQGQHGEAAASLQRGTGQGCPRAQLSDVMNSGNAVLGNYFVVQSVLSAASLRTLSYGAALATLQARRRAVVAQTATIRPNR